MKAGQHSRSRRALHAVVGIVGVCLVAGCASDTAPSPAVTGSTASRSPVTAAPTGGTISGPFMAIRASATGDYSPKLYWDQAGIRGELEVRSGCLVIFSSELGTAVVPVFTADFHWNQDQRTINFGKSTWRVGDEIEVGGGFERPRTVRMDSLLGDELTHRVDRCIELTGAEHWSFATPITGRG